MVKSTAFPPPPTAAAAFVETPIGRLKVSAASGAVTAIGWAPNDADGEDAAAASAASRTAAGDAALVMQALGEIGSYFDGTLHRFSFAVAPAGTPFQHRVWQAMRAIGFGETLSYGELARLLGSSPRAVGQACGRNPVLLAIPCHRIIAAAGAGGFGGRVQRVQHKTSLLAHEAAHAPKTRDDRAADRASILRMTDTRPQDIFARQQNPAA
jgi:methylated-DNA-[protein]-cysteine S-methyltransferase